MCTTSCTQISTQSANVPHYLCYGCTVGTYTTARGLVYTPLVWPTHTTCVGVATAANRPAALSWLSLAYGLRFANAV